MKYEKEQFNKYQAKKKKTVDGWKTESYPDYGKLIEGKVKKPREWTLEDQALEDILWAS